MPLAVYLLGLGIFAQGTSETMLSGLLPGLAADLHTSVPTAGLLISAFALGMLVGAPVLALATLRLPHRTTLVALQLVFAAGHVVSALAPGYGLLLAMRIVTAFAYAGFWAVASVAALGMVPDSAKGKAMSIVASGLTVSTIVGVPAGTALAQHAGWRAAFWAVAAATALTTIGTALSLPRGRRNPDAPAPSVDLRAELRVFRRPQLWAAYGSTALSTGAILVVFSYLAELVTKETGFAESWVPAVLAVYGAAALIGITVGGRTADRAPFPTLLVGLGGLLAADALLAVAAGSKAAAVLLVAAVGGFGFAVNPAVNARVFTVLGATRTVGGAANTSAFNVGITLAPWLGGLAIGAGLGYRATGWIGAAFAAAGICSVLADRALDRRAHRPSTVAASSGSTSIDNQHVRA